MTLHKEKLNNQLNFLINNNLKFAAQTFICNQKDSKKIKFIKKIKKN